MLWFTFYKLLHALCSSQFSQHWGQSHCRMLRCGERIVWREGGAARGLGPSPSA